MRHWLVVGVLILSAAAACRDACGEEPTLPRYGIEHCIQSPVVNRIYCLLEKEYGPERFIAFIGQSDYAALQQDRPVLAAVLGRVNMYVVSDAIYFEKRKSALGGVLYDLSQWDRAKGPFVVGNGLAPFV